MKAEATIAYSARPRLAPLTMAHTTIRMGMNDINPKASANLRSKRSSCRDTTLGPRDARGGVVTSGFIAPGSIPDARRRRQKPTQDYANLSATSRQGSAVSTQHSAVSSSGRRTGGAVSGRVGEKRKRLGVPQVFGFFSLLTAYC